jgi:hypothetical protein
MQPPVSVSSWREGFPPLPPCFQKLLEIIMFGVTDLDEQAAYISFKQLYEIIHFFLVQFDQHISLPSSKRISECRGVLAAERSFLSARTDA